MDGSAGVDRGHKAKTEGDAHRGSLKERNTRGGRRGQSHRIPNTNADRNELQHELTVTSNQSIVPEWVIFGSDFQLHANSSAEVPKLHKVCWSFDPPHWSVKNLYSLCPEDESQ